jgi:hypothetical protein
MSSKTLASHVRATRQNVGVRGAMRASKALISLIAQFLLHLATVNRPSALKRRNSQPNRSINLLGFKPRVQTPAGRANCPQTSDEAAARFMVGVLAGALDHLDHLLIRKPRRSSATYKRAARTQVRDQQGSNG